MIVLLFLKYEINNNVYILKYVSEFKKIYIPPIYSGQFTELY